MQILLKLKGDNIVLPIAYRYFIQSMIYHTLESQPGFSYFMHNKGYSGEERSFKLFSFSPLRGNYSVKDKKITFSDTVSLEIRSTVPEIIESLLKALSEGNTVNIGRNTLTVESCTLKNKTLYKSEAEITTVSPIVAYVTKDSTNRIFFSPDEDEFYSLIINNAKRKWISAGYDESEFDLSIEKTSRKPIRKEVTEFKKSRITAWHGSFVLRGNPEVIDFLYQTGLGSKNSQGFGMFEIIK